MQTITLSEDEKRSLAKMMADAHPHLIRARDRNNFQTIKELRKRYWGGSQLDLLESEKEFLHLLREKEERILAGFIKVSFELCRSFFYAHKLPGISREDYIQEAACAIFECIYMFKGEREFSTFIYWATKNRLIDFVRQQQDLSSIEVKTLSLRAKIVRIMNNELCSFEQAVGKLRAKGVTIDKNQQQKLQGSMTTVIRDDFQDDFQDFKWVLPEKSLIEITEEYHRILQLAGLTDVEREILEMELRDGRGARAHFAKTHRSKNGRPYTKQRASQLLDSAKRKVKAVLDRRAA